MELFGDSYADLTSVVGDILTLLDTVRGGGKGESVDIKNSSDISNIFRAAMV
jgi:hypothetical protein